MLRIEEDTDETMRAIAMDVEQYIGSERKYGFMVLVFPFGQNTRAVHYISNASREDMIKALREKANTLEQGLDISDCGSQQ